MSKYRNRNPKDDSKPVTAEQQLPPSEPKFEGKRNKSNGKSGKRLNSKGRDNDPNWYFTTPQLAEQASQLSFQSMLGSGPIISNYTIPGIMVFRMNPCPGMSYQVTEKATSLPTDAQVQVQPSTNLPSTAVTDIKDGINLMSTKIYTLLSTYSGRTTNYGPEDVAIMNLAISELASTVEAIRRAFGVAMTYSARNRFLPLGILNAMHINAQDMISNMANYRMRFNVAIARINQIPILDNIGYIRKCRDLYQKIYFDEVSSMAQIYFYLPATTWTLSETEVDWTHGSSLRTTTVFPASGTATMATILTTLENMIDKMLFSSTYNIVYSDLINLANKTSVPFTSFDYLAENYVVFPEFNRNANLQMHNLTIFGAPSYGSPNPAGTAKPRIPWNDTLTAAAGSPQNGWMMFTPYNDVFADARTNSVLYNPVFPVMFADMGLQSNVAPWYSGEHIVDMDTDNPTLEDRIEALRFKAIESGYYRSKVDSSTYSFAGYFKILPTLPDHYCTVAEVFTSPTGNPSLISSCFREGSLVPWGGSLTTQLKSAPLQYTKGSNSGNCNNAIIAIYGDVTFWTTIDYNYLYRLNRLITTGLFDFR